MAPLTIVVSTGERILLTTHGCGKGGVYVSATHDRLFLDDYDCLVAEWRSPYHGPPLLHDTPQWMMIRPRCTLIVDHGDEIRLTVMAQLFKQHVSVTEKDGRLIVDGDSREIKFSRLNPDPPAYE